MTFSRITLAGTVDSQPEKRFTPNNTAVTSFMLTVTPPARGNQPAQPYQVQVTCWARTAENVAESVQQGQAVLVEGRLQTQTTPQPDGTQKKSFEIEASQIMVVAGELINTSVDQVISGSEGMAPCMPANAQQGMFANNPMPQQQPQYAAQPAPQPAVGPAAPSTMYTDDDIPF